ncbi:MAG: hypothetical protein PHV59_08605 [Victivallales bacterium]|nr:hypothetical protein [Victivallales bacterium]
MNNFFFIIGFSCGLLLLLTACSTCRPVLYPNGHYREVGREQAEKDIQSAIDNAKKQGLDDTSATHAALARSAGKTAAGTGAAVAVNAASGSAGMGSAASAAGGGMGLLIDWLFVKKTPRPLFRKHVELTLKEQGYQVIGWQ